MPISHQDHITLLIIYIYVNCFTKMCDMIIMVLIDLVCDLNIYINLKCVPVDSG